MEIFSSVGMEQFDADGHSEHKFYFAGFGFRRIRHYPALDDVSSSRLRDGHHRLSAVRRGNFQL